MTPITWMACACMVWPIDPLSPLGRCGGCGERPQRYVTPPPSGMATPLDIYEGDSNA